MIYSLWYLLTQSVELYVTPRSGVTSRTGEALNVTLGNYLYTSASLVIVSAVLIMAFRSSGDRVST